MPDAALVVGALPLAVELVPFVLDFLSDWVFDPFSALDLVDGVVAASDLFLFDYFAAVGCDALLFVDWLAAAPPFDELGATDWPNCLGSGFIFRSGRRFAHRLVVLHG